MLPCYLELIVRKIKWMQSLVLYPIDAGALWASFYGSVSWEQPGQSNPWAECFNEALTYLAFVEGYEDFHVRVPTPVALFDEKDLREWFIKFDVSQLRTVLLDRVTNVF